MTEWKCKRCGRCCGIVPFQQEEYDRVKHTGIQFERQIIAGHVVYIPKSAIKTSSCPFYNRKKKLCEIYELRPEVCRAFGDGPHPCLVCPFNPKFDPEAIKQTAERIHKKDNK